MKTIPYTGQEIVAPDAHHVFLVAQCSNGCQGSAILGTSDGGKTWRTLDALSGSV